MKVNINVFIFVRTFLQQDDGQRGGNKYRLCDSLNIARPLSRSLTLCHLLDAVTSDFFIKYIYCIVNALFDLNELVLVLASAAFFYSFHFFLLLFHHST